MNSIQEMIVEHLEKWEKVSDTNVGNKYALAYGLANLILEKVEGLDKYDVNSESFKDSFVLSTDLIKLFKGEDV